MVQSLFGDYEFSVSSLDPREMQKGKGLMVTQILNHNLLLIYITNSTFLIQKNVDLKLALISQSNQYLCMLTCEL